MNEEFVRKELRELGLSDNEITAYLALLENGSMSAYELSNQTKIARSTIYGLMNSLQDKGLVGERHDTDTTAFTPSTPESVLSLLDERRERVKSIIPSLEELQERTSSLFDINHFGGRQGVKNVMNDIVQEPGTTARFFGVGMKFLEFSEPFVKQYFRRKEENDIFVKGILSDTTEERKIEEEQGVRRSEFRYLPAVQFESSFFIYRDKVAFVSYEANQRGYIIRHEALHNHMEQVFDMLWRTAST